MGHLVRAFRYVIPKYTLTVNINGYGSVTKNPDLPFYPRGTQVTLTASATECVSRSTRSYFSHWSGSESGFTNPFTIIMDSNKTITANFAIEDAVNFLGGTNGSTVYSLGDRIGVTTKVTISLGDVLNTARHSGDGGGDFIVGGLSSTGSYLSSIEEMMYCTCSTLGSSLSRGVSECAVTEWFMNGVTVGGGITTGGTASNRVEHIFFYGSVSNRGDILTIARWGLCGGASGNYAYFATGCHVSGGNVIYVSRIERLLYGETVNATSDAISVPRENTADGHTGSYCYMLGGYNNGVRYATVDRFTYDLAYSNLGNLLSTAVNDWKGISIPNYIVCGGGATSAGLTRNVVFFNIYTNQVEYQGTLLQQARYGLVVV